MKRGMSVKTCRKIRKNLETLDRNLMGEWKKTKELRYICYQLLDTYNSRFVDYRTPSGRKSRSGSLHKEQILDRALLGDTHSDLDAVVKLLDAARILLGRAQHRTQMRETVVKKLKRSSKTNRDWNKPMRVNPEVAKEINRA